MGDLKVALVHDELVRRGGAEIVFEEMIRLFPQADVYALYASNRPRITINEKTYPIRTSSLQRLPLWFRKHPSRVLPLLLYAAERFDFSQYDLVISSSSGFAKGIITRASIPYICYCHAPTRYLWDATHEVGKTYKFGGKTLGRILLHTLRLADFAAGQRPDVFIANSKYTQERIARVYRRPSELVYPPIDTAFFTPGKRTVEHAPFVVLSRLTPLKHIEHAIIACEKLALPLVVIGTGAETEHLKSFARRYTKFVGKVSAEEVRRYLREARALLQPGVEDFGMATAEALACGTPVIAYGRGGVKEIVRDGKDGILYTNSGPEGLAEAIHAFLPQEATFQAETLQRQAMQFSRYRFAEGIERVVEKTLQNRHKMA